LRCAGKSSESFLRFVGGPIRIVVRVDHFRSFVVLGLIGAVGSVALEQRERLFIGAVVGRR